MAASIVIAPIDPARPLTVSAELVDLDTVAAEPGEASWRQLTPAPAVDYGRSPWAVGVVLDLVGPPDAVFRITAIMYSATDQLVAAPATNYLAPPFPVADTWPTIEDVRAFLRLPLTISADDETTLTAALNAAIDYGNRRTNFRYDPRALEVEPVPALAHYACTVHAAQLYRRRDSTDGTIGFDAGVVRVTARDPQVEFNYAALGPMVFA